MKTICSRVRRLEIAVSLYSPAKGSRAIYYSKKIPRSRIREVGSGSQVIGRGAISLFHSYYLWEFGSFLCFFSFVVSLLCNPNKYSREQRGRRLFPPIISPSVALELKGYCKGTSRVTLSKFWGSDLLMAQRQIVYCVPIVPDFSCLCHAVWCLLILVLEHSVIIDRLPW